MCAVLNVDGKTPVCNDLFTMSVMGMISESIHDFNRVVGIASRSQDLLGEDMISFFTSSCVAGLKEVVAATMMTTPLSNSQVRLLTCHF